MSDTTGPAGPRPRVAVSGGGVASGDDTDLAYAVGAGIARAGAILVTGGRSGVMEAACRGAFDAGGTTLAFLPGEDPSEANAWVTIPVATGMGQGRNILVVRAAEAVIAIGGEWGTLAEIALARKLDIPVVLLRPTLGASLALPVAAGPEHAVSLALELACSRRPDPEHRGE